jgi:hypothetical protein
MRPIPGRIRLPGDLVREIDAQDQVVVHVEVVRPTEHGTPDGDRHVEQLIAEAFQHVLAYAAELERVDEPVQHLQAFGAQRRTCLLALDSSNRLDDRLNHRAMKLPLTRQRVAAARQPEPSRRDRFVILAICRCDQCNRRHGAALWRRCSRAITCSEKRRRPDMVVAFIAAILGRA